VRIAIAAACGLLAPTAAQAQGSCSACVDFVTTSPTGGVRTAPPVTRMHKGLVANVPYVLDVDGPLPPLPLGVLPVLPGYEIRATVEGLDAEKPTIRIERLLVPPTPLPLRIEVVRADGARWQSLGYDTLGTTAPKSFTASLDLSNRDANPATDQTAVALTVTGAPTSLTLVNEQFGGDPAGTRTARSVRRLEFSGDGTATRVPGAASLDITTSPASAPTRHQIRVTRDVATKVNFELSEPGATRTTGTIATLPAWAELILTDVDVDGDGRRDLKLDYAAAAITDVIVDTDDGRRHTHADVDRVPTAAHLTYASPPQTAPLPRRTQVTYHANGRAKRAHVSTSAGPQGNSESLDVDVTDLPANVDKLWHVARADGATIDYESDASSTALSATSRSVSAAGTKQVKADVTALPADVELTQSSGPGGTHVDYVADGRATRAVVGLVDDAQTIDLRLDATQQPKQPPTQGLPTEMHFDSVKATGGNELDFTTTAAIPVVSMHGRGLEGLPARVTDLDVQVRGLPTALAFDTHKSASTTSQTYVDCEQGKPTCKLDCDGIPRSDQCKWYVFERDYPDCDINDIKPGVCPQTMPWPTSTKTVESSGSDIVVDAGSGTVGSAEVQLTSGPDLRLGATAPPRLVNGVVVTPPQDGVRLEDVADHYVAHTRATGLRKAVVQSSERDTRVRGHTISGDEIASTHLDMTSTAPGHALAVQKRLTADSGEVKDSNLLLAELPSTLTATMIDHNSDKNVQYTAAKAVPGYTRPDGSPAPAFEQVDSIGTEPSSSVTMDPMPKHLGICKAGVGTDCSEGVFDANVATLRDGNYPLTSYRCFGNGCIGGRELPISPTQASKGSVHISADPPTTLHYGAGSTDLSFVNLGVFSLQAHQTSYACTSETVAYTCRSGYIGVDSAGAPLVGHLVSGDTEFFFPGADLSAVPFTSTRHVWGFNETGWQQGEVGIVGPVRCPDHTKIVASGTNHTRRFCEGHLTEWETIDL
jgi:hypothetical protein